MIVLRREIARQAPDFFGNADQHIREVIVLRPGNRRDFDFRAIPQSGDARENHHAVFDFAFVAHGRNLAVAGARANFRFFQRKDAKLQRRKGNRELR